MSRTINIGASHGDGNEVIFHLRSISTAEENRYTAQFSDISDVDSFEVRAEKEYGILVDAIASWSEEEPTIKVKGVVEATSSESPAAGVRAYFEERTNEKERIANQVVLAFRRKLQPDVVFY